LKFITQKRFATEQAHYEESVFVGVEFGRSRFLVWRLPAAQGRAVALRVEPLSKAQRLAPSGCHP